MKSVAMWLLIAFCLVFSFSVWYFNLKGPVEVQCKVDADCTFVRTKCCPECSDFKAVNKDAYWLINSEFDQTCTEDCNDSSCSNPTGGLYYAYPKCIQGKCTSIDKVNCEAVCKYYLYYYKEPQITFLKETTKRMNMTKIEELVNVCCKLGLKV